MLIERNIQKQTLFIYFSFFQQLLWSRGEGEEPAVQAGWSTVRLVDSINSCSPREVEGEGDSCASRLVNSAPC
jgi:hypothetical protein